MARQPEVFVRELDPAEAQRLVKITRTARDRVRLRRAGIVLASVQGRSAAEAGAMFAATPQYAREVIHAFNDQGFAALDPNGAGAVLLSSAPTSASWSAGPPGPHRSRSVAGWS
jgi:2-keto-3-deoxy-6-phosphogluconate aldolase